MTKARNGENLGMMDDALLTDYFAVLFSMPLLDVTEIDTVRPQHPAADPSPVLQEVDPPSSPT